MRRGEIVPHKHPPRAAEHIYSIYWQVAAFRDPMGGALLPSEVEAWARLTNTRILPWEARALFVMDAKRRAIEYEINKPRDSVLEEPVAELSPAIFDAVFS